MSQEISVIKSIAVTSAMLVGTDVAEADYAEYSAGTTYAAGDRVIVAAQHKVYESLVAGNVGNNPVTSATKWVEVSATNRWKLFDLSNTTQTAIVGSAYYEVKPGAAINSVALMNIAGIASVRIKLTDPAFGVVYDQLAYLAPTISSSSWYAWFYEPRTQIEQLIVSDLPSYPNATLRVEITAGSTGYVGVLTMGYRKVIGMGPMVGVRLGIQDYSRKERNTFGDVVLVQRAYARRNNLTALVRNSELDNVIRTLASLRATPCIWIASGRLDSLVVFGFYNSFDVVIPYREYSELSIDIEGMT